MPQWCIRPARYLLIRCKHDPKLRLWHVVVVRLEARRLVLEAAADANTGANPGSAPMDFFTSPNLPLTQPTSGATFDQIKYCEML